jgi:hypothetical protein
MTINVDGATLDGHVHHVTLGFNICDAIACGPVPGELLFDQSKADGDEGNLQSAWWCFSVICIIAKDEKIHLRSTFEKYLSFVRSYAPSHSTGGNLSGFRNPKT